MTIRQQNQLIFSTVLILILFVVAMLIRDNVTSDDDPAQAVFGGQGVRVYQHPDDSSMLLGIMAQGTVDIADISNDNLWIQVPFGDGFGWVEINAVSIQGTLTPRPTPTFEIVPT